jgi:hypothetical protein
MSIAPQKHWILGLAAILLDCGCGTSGTGKTPPEPPPIITHIAIDAPSMTNRGTVLHLMLTTVDAKVSTGGSYDEEAARFVASPQDRSIVGTGVILPGGTLKIQASVPAEQPLALAFFFTEPGANWRVVVPPPIPSRVSVLLGADGVDRLEAGNGR